MKIGTPRDGQGNVIAGGGVSELSASYVVLALTSSLANERVLTAGTGVTITDNGANNTVVIAATGGGGSATSGSMVFPSQNIVNIGTRGMNSQVAVTSSVAWQTVSQLSTQLQTDGGAVLLTAQFSALTTDTSTFAAFTLLRDGSDLSNVAGGFQMISPDNSFAGEANAITLSYIDPVPKGTYTYAVGAKIVAGIGSGTIGISATGNLTSSLSQINAIELPGTARYATGSLATATAMPTSFAVISGVSASLPVTGPVFIFLNACTKATAATTVPCMALFRDSTNLGNTSYGQTIPVINSSGSVLPSSLIFCDQPTVVGTYTYTVRTNNLGAVAEMSPLIGSSQTKSWFGVIDLGSVNVRQTTATTLTNFGTGFAEFPLLKHTISTTGKPILIGVTVDQNATAISAKAAYTIFRDGVNIGAPADGVAVVGSYNSNSKNAPVTLLFTDTPPAGNHTYALANNNLTGSAQISEVNEVQNIFTVELAPTNVSATGWIDGGLKLRTSASVSIDSSGNFAENKGADTYFYVSGTIGLSGSVAKKAVFGGDVVISGSIIGTYHPVTSSTYWWYKCNEAAGALTNSIGVGANPLTTIVGPPAYQMPTLFAHGTPALQWWKAGSSDSAIGTGLTASLANGITLEAIVLPLNFSQVGVFVEIANTTRGNGLLHLVVNAGNIAATVYNGTQTDVSAPTPLNIPGQRMHVMMTYKDTTINLYVNGILAATNAATVNISAVQMNQISLGGALVATVPYLGLMADARVSLEVLPQSYAVAATKAMNML